MRRLNIGGSAWVGQVAYGFPTAGAWSRKYLLPRVGNLGVRLPAREIPDSSTARFRERGAESGGKHGPLIRREATGKAMDGCLLPPNPLSDEGKPLEWRSKRYNISVRFGVLQSDKLRACGDLKRPMTRSARTAPTPTQLVSWYNVDQISQLLSADGGAIGCCPMKTRWLRINSRPPPLLTQPLISSLSDARARIGGMDSSPVP